MAKKQEKELLTYINLLDELYFIKNKAESLKMTSSQIRDLKFYKQDIFGKTTLVKNLKLNLAQNGNQIIILMLEE